MQGGGLDRDPVLRPGAGVDHGQHQRCPSNGAPLGTVPLGTVPRNGVEANLEDVHDGILIGTLPRIPGFHVDYCHGHIELIVAGRSGAFHDGSASLLTDRLAAGLPTDCG